MTPTNFKVIFKGSKKNSQNDLSLTFKSIVSEKIISIPKLIILKLKKLSKTNPNVTNLQNIGEVLKIGAGASSSEHNYYFVILYTKKKDTKRIGLLIGNVKNQGDLLIGIWPFNEQVSESLIDELLKDLQHLIKEPHDYQDISLITG